MSKPTTRATAKKRATLSAVEKALARVREISLALPGTTESVNHGHPCFQVGGKSFVMFLDDHHSDGRLAIWCKAPPGAQGMLVEAEPERFFVPPYVGPRGWIGVRLERERVDWAAVASCVEESWRMTAPKRVLSQLGSGRG